MSTDQFVDICAVILGIMIVIRLVLRVIRSRMEYKQIQKNMEQMMKDKGLSYGNKDEHRDQRS
jgi:hypothetical protein